ncbi:hypothetical protein FRC11_001930 [Ceratobasidium sp. 423]|nr:hypothetical protein FRC11_001930 [Ceratobasidium sp. 423]
MNGAQMLMDIARRHFKLHYNTSRARRQSQYLPCPNVETQGETQGPNTEVEDGDSLIVVVVHDSGGQGGNLFDLS